jgi:subtilisin family serine protease
MRIGIGRTSVGECSIAPVVGRGSSVVGGGDDHTVSGDGRSIVLCSRAAAVRRREDEAVGRIVRDARGTALLFAAVMCASVFGSPGRSHSAASSGIAYYDAAAARGATSIIVRARGSDDLDAIAKRSSALGYRSVRRAVEPPALELTPPTGVDLARAGDVLAALPGVAYTEPSYRVRLTDVPAAPLYAEQSSYLNAEQAPEAWDIEKGRASVVVAVLDTGLDITHPDLRGRVWTNPGEIGADGCAGDVHGCAFVGEPAAGCAAPSGGDIHDDLGHGTFVAGIIAANGSDGMVGVARGVTIMPVKVLDCTGVGGSIELAEGMLYAVRHGASVLNLSLGYSIESKFVHEAIDIARDTYGVLLVAATGNTGGAVTFPARYPEVLAVGAESASQPGQRAVFSGAGPEVDVVAIGEGIIGTIPKGACSALLTCLPGDDTHATGSGTSFAAPQVTGLVALMLSRNHYLQPDQIINVVKATADPLPGGEPAGWAGAGRINMLRALTPQYRIGTPGTARS